MQEKHRNSQRDLEKTSETQHSIERNVETCERLVSLAPMCVAILSQLVIIAANLRDSAKDHHKHRLNLIKRAESLRQIANQGCSAFEKIHNNMKKIGFLMQKVPVHVANVVIFLKCGHLPIGERLLANHLNSIREIEEESLKLAKEANSFAQLSKLIDQVIEAFSLSERAKMLQDEECLNKLEEEKLRLKEEFERKNKNLQELMDQGLETKDAEIDQTIEEMEKIAEWIDEINITTLLHEITKKLIELKGHCLALSVFSKSFANFINHATDQLRDFREQAELVLQNRAILPLMADCTSQTSQNSYLIYRTTEIYVNVSSRYIMGSVANLEKTIAASGNIEEAHRELVNSCQEAATGITTMVRESKQKLVSEIDQWPTEFDTCLLPSTPHLA